MAALFIVDVPNAYSPEWDNVGYFDTKQEAVDFCKRYGADDEGRVNLITETDDGEKEADEDA